MELLESAYWNKRMSQKLRDILELLPDAELESLVNTNDDVMNESILQTLTLHDALQILLMVLENRFTVIFNDHRLPGNRESIQQIVVEFVGILEADFITQQRRQKLRANNLYFVDIL